MLAIYWNKGGGLCRAVFALTVFCALNLSLFAQDNQSGQDRYSQCEALYLQGITLEKQGDLVSAGFAYEQCRELAKQHKLPQIESKTLHRQAVIKAQTRKFTESAELFRSAIALDDKNPAILCDFAQLYADRRMYEDAEIVLKKALLLAPNNAKVLYNLGITIAQHRDRQAEGFQYLKQALGEAQGYRELAKLYRSKGDVGQAELTEQKANLAETQGKTQPEPASAIPPAVALKAQEGLMRQESKETAQKKAEQAKQKLVVLPPPVREAAPVRPEILPVPIPQPVGNITVQATNTAQKPVEEFVPSKTEAAREKIVRIESKSTPQIPLTTLTAHNMPSQHYASLTQPISSVRIPEEAAGAGTIKRLPQLEEKQPAVPQTNPDENKIKDKLQVRPIPIVGHSLIDSDFNTLAIDPIPEIRNESAVARRSVSFAEPMNYSSITLQKSPALQFVSETQTAVHNGVGDIGLLQPVKLVSLNMDEPEASAGISNRQTNINTSRQTPPPKTDISSLQVRNSKQGSNLQTVKEKPKGTSPPLVMLSQKKLVRQAAGSEHQFVNESAPNVLQFGITETASRNSIQTEIKNEPRSIYGKESVITPRVLGFEMKQDGSPKNSTSDSIHNETRHNEVQKPAKRISSADSGKTEQQDNELVDPFLLHQNALQTQPDTVTEKSTGETYSRQVKPLPDNDDFARLKADTGVQSKLKPAESESKYAVKRLPDSQELQNRSPQTVTVVPPVAEAAPIKETTQYPQTNVPVYSEPFPFQKRLSAITETRQENKLPGNFTNTLSAEPENVTLPPQGQPAGFAPSKKR